MTAPLDSQYDTVNVVAVVGTDFPAHYLDQFKQRRTDLRGLRAEPGATFRWGARYHLDMNARDTLFTELGVFADFHPDLPQEYCRAEVTFASAARDAEFTHRIFVDPETIIDMDHVSVVIPTRVTRDDGSVKATVYLVGPDA